MNEHTLCHIGFSHFYGIGPVKFAALKNRFESVKHAYYATTHELETVLGSLWAKRFVDFRNHIDLNKKWEEFNKKKITVLTIDDEFYPTSLKNISDAPICIYVKGNIKTVDLREGKLFGIVGTRRPTSYGCQIAHTFSSELADAGFVIVSGLAIGVDTIAHKAALHAGSKTIAVLGCGVDIIYPQSNSFLYEKIVDNGGLVMSEFPPGLMVKRGLFIARNRIISGLSMGVLVVEGTKDSGALITARFAAQQGREVFAPPVPLTSIMSEAPNILLKQGAIFVTQTEDILDEFGIKKWKKNEAIISTLSPSEKIVVEILSLEPKSVDELLLEIKTPISHLSYTLSILEMEGIIKKDAQSKYQLASMGK
ncbi:DNA protecting protein DprA [Candidatus Roizmanbacteria bacterium RIFOXYB2_FULL_38_10]|uniref:DNA protecting protein DprA n=1 Tax=Candidatus Roizmanbacteria bacterium RIFOXYD1_FULL_38_12 TaxID=1802093 RepID=A0A1F7L2G2_9BACT|nr:MAG: DNA protecting protein DprA [Candidatus Roizmanbacteria bacterium RIFOXYA2_FULL_38_14]OGK64298.1 MAG: DNA protecting protein DprA [Candidatus Roizmanbacteria bacterium RIFOXYA1_FULL_37_12]OGK66144.1 MAG: DNA protecting protein DprA [Candidatus Roizmanbacteria bacterium RIFOXYB1_FULL_40_23]OGK67837.1 MAG: DNA protecting protein DprA [Candidatus Roizmanbacteria bacterium RIFOXYB2_FULL_38_10]OGK70549.1 MAG: DNA protecting protein DprA [Candidatus Roizmanbacteria bacterium RIFOXYC1_FULL_38_